MSAKIPSKASQNDRSHLIRFAMIPATLFLLWMCLPTYFAAARTEAFLTASHGSTRSIRATSPYVVHQKDDGGGSSTPRRSQTSVIVHASRCSRRDVLGSVPPAVLLGPGSLGRGPVATAATAPPATKTSTRTIEPPFVDLPMIRISLPKGGFGRNYIAIPITIAGRGPFDFMVDSGLTTEMITPHLEHQLQLGGGKTAGIQLQGLAAGGSSQIGSLTLLENASLSGSDGQELKLPPLHAVVTNFPQEHMDPKHDPIEGMLGMELLELFDVDFDFHAKRVRLSAAGTADKTGLVEIPAVVINETGLLGIRLASPGAPQPVLALLDCGSAFTAINWKAADLFGLPERDDGRYQNGPSIMAVGIDGRPLQLPTVTTSLTFTGDAIIDSATGQPMGFAPAPSFFQPWKTVVAVGDLPVFSQALGDGRRPYQGPAVLLGLDVLASRGRLVLEADAGSNTRRRRVWVSPN